MEQYRFNIKTAKNFLEDANQCLQDILNVGGSASSELPIQEEKKDEQKWYVYHFCAPPTNWTCLLQLRLTTREYLKAQAKKYKKPLTIINAYDSEKEAIKATCSALTECVPSRNEGTTRHHAIAKLKGEIFNVSKFRNGSCKCHKQEEKKK